MSGGLRPEGSGHVSWPPGEFPEPTSKSMASGQVSLSTSHVFMMAFFKFVFSILPCMLVVTGASEGIGRGLHSGGILGGCIIKQQCDCFSSHFSWPGRN